MTHTGKTVRADSRRRIGAVLAGRNSLDIPEHMTIEDWRRVGERIFLINDASAWWMGDWLIYGRERFPDRYRRALAETGLDYQTLRNYAWVAGRFDPGRRRADLSFQHHAEVASLPEPEQDRWLDMAQSSAWSRSRLRADIKASRAAGGAPPASSGQVEVVAAIPTARIQEWQEAAGRNGRDLSEWIIEILNEAASAG
jgi:hypothetical protein